MPPLIPNMPLASSLKSMFTPRGASAGSETTRLSLKDAVATLTEAPSAPDAQLVRCAKRLLELCSNYEKIAIAAKAGAMEAVCGALDHFVDAEKPELCKELLPVLINLSGGDDEVGLARAERLVELDAVEAIAHVLETFGTAHDEAARGPENALDDMTRALNLRCLWALQHLSRRSAQGSAQGVVRPLISSSSASSSAAGGGAEPPPPWLLRLCGSGILDYLCELPRRCPPEIEPGLITRACFEAAAVCYSGGDAERIKVRLVD